MRGSFNLAVAFDLEVAKAIGNNMAFINLETEWDDGAVLNIFKTAEGSKCLTDRIQNFKTYSPNAVIVSSPGLWKPNSDYPFFKPIDGVLNARAMLLHTVNSADGSCAARTDGSWWPNGVKSLAEGVSSIMDKINGNLEKMNSAWGSTGKEWMISDMAVTSCGWGSEGQSQILNALVKVSFFQNDQLTIFRIWIVCTSKVSVDLF